MGVSCLKGSGPICVWRSEDQEFVSGSTKHYLEVLRHIAALGHGFLKYKLEILDLMISQIH